MKYKLMTIIGIVGSTVASAFGGWDRFLESLVKVGDIKIYLDTKLPGDICEGEYISFTISRLDLWVFRMQ